jgi:hypothetical protein
MYPLNFLLLWREGAAMTLFGLLLFLFASLRFHKRLR